MFWLVILEAGFAPWPVREYPTLEACRAAVEAGPVAEYAAAYDITLACVVIKEASDD